MTDPRPSTPEESRTVRFILDGQPVAVHAPAPDRTLLSYLRLDCGRTGTKEGCAEGDCGACTVVVGESAGDGAALAWRAVNACIRFLPTLDGKEVVTVQGLKAPDGTLHPVQQAMVEAHASQCGFCTPGFVMSLFALYLANPKPTREEVLDALAGNLCRCTGYRPIVDAALRMGEAPTPAHWGREAAQDPARRDRLAALRRRESLRIPTAPGFVAPRSEDELAAALEAAPDSLVLAGATDIGLWVTKQLRTLPPLVYLGEAEDLKTLREADGHLQIGAAVTLMDAWAAIVARWPALAELANRFASPPIRNAGTLCGNLANGSPIGDAMPALIALGARVRLRKGARRRELPLEDLYLGYQKKAFEPGEFLASVAVPLPRPHQRVASDKVSKRFDQDISAVCSGLAVTVEGGRITAARVAYGGMGPTPARAPRAEAALTGQPWSAASFEAAAAALAQDYRPIDDLRASAAYRLQVAQNLLRRFYLAQEGRPVRVTDLPPA